MLLRGLLSAAAVLWLAGSASALIISYDMTGSEMSMVNTVAGGPCNPCLVPVTGSLTLIDDEVGNITLSSLNLAHVGYEVGTPGIVSVVIERTAITLGAGPVGGAGSTLGSNVLFGLTDIAQTGTTTCTPGIFSCALAGLPAGSSPLASPLTDIDLGNWIFDGLRDLSSASIVYTNQSGAVETLNLVGTATIIPEPATMLLVAAGLVGMAVRRRAQA